jgi:hypothetical protein
MMESQVVYILVDRQADKPIDLDVASGGYPYCVTSLHCAQVFLTEESAKKYCDHFKDKFVIRKMKLELEKEEKPAPRLITTNQESYEVCSKCGSYYGACEHTS